MIPKWLLLPCIPYQTLFLCCSLLHEFLFTFLSVYCTLNGNVATIHRRTMGIGRQWMTGMRKSFLVVGLFCWLVFFFNFSLLLLLLLLENNLGEPSDEKNLFFCQLLPGASVRLFKALWEVVWGKVASKQHIELHLFPPYKKAPKTNKQTKKYQHPNQQTTTTNKQREKGKKKNPTKKTNYRRYWALFSTRTWLKLNIQASDINVHCRNP